MQFKQYPSYKPSGVEWLGDVPEHWQQKPIWSLFKRIKRTNFPTERLLSVYRDYGVIPKDSRDDNHNRASEDLTPYQLVCANDLVINKMKAWQGSIAISELRGIVSPAYYIYQPKAEYHSKYIHFLIRSAYYIQSYKNYSKGIRVNQWDLESEAFTHIDLLLPSLDEQEKIVAFLDTETARIDTLIAKQEKLIELLEEQRKSIISHAVTKGLNPNAPMKDSGVEWLGEVPEPWKLTPIKHLVYTQKGFAFSSHIFKEDGVGITKASDIKNGTILKPSTFIDENHFDDYQKYQLYSNDIIISTVGSTPDVVNSAVGQIGILPQDLQGCLLNQNTVIFRSKSNKIEQKFLYYVLLSNGYRSYLDLYAHGTANQASLSIVDMLAFSIPLPLKKEQMDIVRHIEEKSSKIDTLIAKQRELIEKLKSYRTSIISHAVTGKIDVRDLVA